MGVNHKSVAPDSLYPGHPDRPKWNLRRFAFRFGRPGKRQVIPYWFYDAKYNFALITSERPTGTDTRPPMRALKSRILTAESKQVVKPFDLRIPEVPFNPIVVAQNLRGLISGKIERLVSGEFRADGQDAEALVAIARRVGRKVRQAINHTNPLNSLSVIWAGGPLWRIAKAFFDGSNNEKKFLGIRLLVALGNYDAVVSSVRGADADILEHSLFLLARSSPRHCARLISEITSDINSGRISDPRIWRALSASYDEVRRRAPALKLADPFQDDPLTLSPAEARDPSD